MHVTALLLTMGMAFTTLVPPGELTEDHTQPYHWDQPVARRFERRTEDDDRRVAWESHVAELDELWQEYRDAGSTPSAWRAYKQSAAAAKRRYVVNDAYLLPVAP